uniref:PHD-type domain-containing protein n=1 Tax=Anopheles culicifacies TaxID=139723 RepID=A0A182MH93_9DIPT
MSGHNPPHGRLGQPNTTWNPLQVPSYVPRQPQLAHMSSERSMARSPLTWATPPTTHQDKVYSLMTGNLMNNLEMNPLLQGYGRNVGMPLGSVDLTLSSASRSTPSPKGAHNNIQTASTSSSHSTHTSSSSTTLPSNIPTSGVHSMAGDSGLSGSNHQARTAGTTSVSVVPSSGGVIQSTTVAALKERMQGTGGASMPPAGAGTTSNNFGMTNTINDSSSSTLGASIVRGGNGFGAGLSNRTANDLAALVSGSLLVKDAKQINSEMDSKNGRDCFSHLSCTDSADLMKEFVLQTMQCNALSVSPKRTSPARSSVQSTLSPNRSRSPPLNLLLGPSTIDGKLGVVDCLNSAFPLPSNNSAGSVPSLPLSSESPAPAASLEGTDIGTVTARAIGSLLAGTGSELNTGTSTPCPINPSASPTGNSMASSEDSVDSSNSRSNNTRRRRKPEKTNKMNAAFPLEEGKSLFPVAKPIDGGMGMEELDSLRTNHTARNDITALAIEGINALSHGLSGAQCDLSQNVPLVSMSESNAREGSGMHTPHDIFLPHHAHRKPPAETSHDPQKLLETLIQSNMNNNGTGLQTSSPAVAASSNSSTVPCPADGANALQKQHDTNDCETIDKIAAMVSSTNAMARKLLLDKGTTETTNDNGLVGSIANTPEINCNGPVQLEANATQHEEKNSRKAEKKANAADSSYEEVENKLEEMFAGIEEQPGNCVDAGAQKDSSDGSESRSIAGKVTSIERDHAADGDVMKQLSNDLLADRTSDTSQPARTDVPASSSNGSGKKPLTPAQKRSIGNKANAAEMTTSTPAVKRKRGPKKKTNAHSKPAISPYIEPEGPAMLGLKALSNKKKGKNGKATGAGTGKKGKAAKGKPGSKADERETGAGWSAGPASSIEASGKYKGPYVQVRTDGCHTVINAPLNEEDSEKTQNKTKKFSNSLNSSERSKIRGLHVSTLSTKYDADTTDTSWMCVFCKTGPHKFRLGDLFGPYIISTSSSEYEQSQIDVDYFSVRRTREDLESNQAKQKRAAEKLKEQQQCGSKSKKRKNATGAAVNVGQASVTAGPSHAKELTLKEEKCDDTLPADQHTSTEIFYGMNKASDNTYEVWTHEDCLVWAPGVYMVGTRVVGLEAAIWNCCRHQCQLCRNYGAVLSCLHQGCPAKAHYICAHKQSWKMTEDFQSFCQLHAAGKEQPDSGGEGPSSSRREEVASPAAPPLLASASKQPKKETKPGKKAAASLTTSAS